MKFSHFRNGGCWWIRWIHQRIVVHQSVNYMHEKSLNHLSVAVECCAYMELETNKKKVDSLSFISVFCFSYDCTCVGFRIDWIIARFPAIHNDSIFVWSESFQVIFNLYCGNPEKRSFVCFIDWDFYAIDPDPMIFCGLRLSFSIVTWSMPASPDTMLSKKKEASGKETKRKRRAMRTNE